MVDIPEGVKPRLPGGFQLPPFGIHQFLALMIVCVALWVIGAVWLGMQGAQQWVGSWQQSLKLHVYLDQGQPKKLKALQGSLESFNGIDSVRVIGRHEASRWMQEWLGDTALNAGELAKKLPDALELTLSQSDNEFLFTDIRDEVARHNANINEDEIQLAQMHAMLSNLRMLVWFVTVLLALAMALIISNTLRMILLARADEVHLMRLLGAKEWFVRMPFVLEGVVLGAGAGFIGWVLLWPLIVALSDWVAVMGISLSGWSLFFPMLIGGAVPGCLGALIATAKLTSPDDIDHV
ncbi:MAG: FtsX-like permease family protein [Mariprofundaceae bacterium]